MCKIFSQHFVFCWCCCLSSTHSFLPTLSYYHYASMYALGLTLLLTSNHYRLIINVSYIVESKDLYFLIQEIYAGAQNNLFSLFLLIVFSVCLSFSFLHFSCTDCPQLITYQSSVPITNNITNDPFVHLCNFHTFSLTHYKTRRRSVGISAKFPSSRNINSQCGCA